MPFINKVTVRGTTYYLENLTDGSNIVRLPKGISANDYFVTENTLGTFTVSKKELDDFKTEVSNDFDAFKDETADQFDQLEADISTNISTFKRELENDINEFKNEVNQLAKYELPIATESELGGVKAVAKDGFNISATLTYPRIKNQKEYSTVVLLHSLGYNSQWWGDLPRRIARSCVPPNRQRPSAFRTAFSICERISGAR